MRKETDISKIEHEPVKQAFAKLQELSGDPDVRRLAAVREKVLFKDAMAYKYAQEQGVDDEAEWYRLNGEVKLEKQDQIQLVALLVSTRFGYVPDDVTEKINAASSEQLDQWVDDILTLETLEQVFQKGKDSPS